MSLINEALNKGQNGANAVQNHVLPGTVADGTKGLAYNDRKDVNKGKTSFLSLSILGTILAGAIVFYYICNFTNLTPQLSSGKKVEFHLKDNMAFAMYEKVNKETAPVPPESIQVMAKVESQPDIITTTPPSPPSQGGNNGEVKQFEELAVTNKDVVVTFAQVQDSALIEPSPSSVTNMTQSTQEVVSPVEAQIVESFEAETQIPEGVVEQKAQILPVQLQSNDNWNVSYHIGMGVFHQKNKEFEKAIEEYNKVIELDTNNAEVHINLGVIYKDKGALDKAVEEYKKALTIDPWLEAGYNNLGVMYFLKGNYAEAIKQYQKAVEINPKNLESYINLGVVYGMQKRGEEAVRAFQTAISINPQHAETFYNLAVVYDENGEIDKALRYYSKFVELNHSTKTELIDKVKKRINVMSTRRVVNEVLPR